MVSPKPNKNADDKHLLRTDAENDPHIAISHPEATSVPQDPIPSTAWPLPDDLDTILDRLDQWNRFIVMAVRIDPPMAAQESRVFHEWLGDGWGLIFSHPQDYTPVCTTELGVVANLKEEFQKRRIIN